MPHILDRSRPTPDLTAVERILAAIRDVPHGQVAGYGVIALRAGLPGRARMVARLLATHAGTGLPWHRILRSDGRIALPPGSEGHLEQARRLRAEGVDVRNGRVRMHAARDDVEAEIWRPD